MKCRRCGNLYRRRDGFGSVSWGRGEDELEQLRSYTRWELCGDCTLTLKAWLGIRPEFPEAVADDLPTRPFSCSDERINY